MLIVPTAQLHDGTSDGSSRLCCWETLASLNDPSDYCSCKHRWLLSLDDGVGKQQCDLDLFYALDDGPPTEKPKVPKAPKNPDLDLFDALDDGPPTEKPKVPEAPKNPDPEPDKPAVVPPKDGGTGGTGGFDINDAFGDPEHTPTDPKKPAGDPEPDKPAVVPPKDGGTGGTGGGSFSLDDLGDVAGGNDYKPDEGRGGARAADPAYDGPANDQPAEASSGPLAGILGAVGVAIVGAASSYFAYQKKKLCFKLQGGADPESGKTHQGTESEPQVLSDLLRSS